MGDDGWRSQPKLMSAQVIAQVAARLGEQYRKQRLAFSVVLHGGEPLMLGAARLEALCSQLRAELPHPCGIHLQTNGILLTDSVIDVLVRYDVGISVSFDGPEAVHDRFRLDHQQRGSHARVADGINRVMARDDARPLFAGLLSVIDPTSDPAAVYSALKATGSPSLDFLVRDGNWDQIPSGKAAADTTEFGNWLCQLLDVYLADPTPPRVRILDDMLKLMLGGNAQKEGIGTADYGILVIEPDGRIEKNDTLKVAHAAADRFDRPWSVLKDTLEDVLSSAAFDAYYRQQRPISAICSACPDLGVCGGGMVAHRWSAQNGFDNPTIFCADQKMLMKQMRAVLARAQAQAA